jgi:hypothetical protein
LKPEWNIEPRLGVGGRGLGFGGELLAGEIAFLIAEFQNVQKLRFTNKLIILQQLADFRGRR